MVCSLDGFIAKPDNSVDWLERTGKPYEKGIADEDAVMPPIDCFVLGSRTYEHALEIGWPYGDTPTVVVTSRPLTPNRPSVELYAGDLRALVREHLAPQFRHIWLVGGAALGTAVLQQGLVNEIRLAIIPVLLGDGLRFFGPGLSERQCHLKESVAYRSGIVELVYEVDSDLPKA